MICYRLEVKNLCEEGKRGDHLYVQYSRLSTVLYQSITRHVNHIYSTVRTVYVLCYSALYGIAYAGVLVVVLSHVLWVCESRCRSKSQTRSFSP